MKSEPTAIEFVDSTSIKVCHNLRIQRHITLSEQACSGKGTMGYFYGFKRHLFLNHQEGIVAAQITAADVDVTKPVADGVFRPKNKLYAEKGHISKAGQ